MAMFNFDFSGTREAQKEYYEAQRELAAQRAAQVQAEIAAAERKNRGEYTAYEKWEMDQTGMENQSKYNNSLASLADSGTRAGQLEFDRNKYNDPVEAQKRQAEVDVKLAEADSNRASARKTTAEAQQLEDTYNQFNMYRQSMTSLAGDEAGIRGKMAALQTAQQAGIGGLDPMVVNVEMARHQAELDAINDQKNILRSNLLIAGIAGNRNEAAINALMANASGLDPAAFKSIGSRGRGGSESSDEPTFEYTQSIGNDTDPNAPKKTIKFKAPLADLPKYDFGNSKGFSVGEMLPQGYSGMTQSQAASAASPFMMPYTGVNPASIGEMPVSAGSLFNTTNSPVSPTQPSSPTRRWVWDAATQTMKPQ